MKLSIGNSIEKIINKCLKASNSISPKANFAKENKVTNSIFSAVPPSVFRERLMPQVTMKDVCKMRCIDALKDTKPYEKVFILDSRTGVKLSEINGQLESCKISQKLINNGDVTVLHGHPQFENGVSLPVSLQDFILMNDSSVNEIVAYNINGLESSLKKTPKFEKLKSSQIKELKNKYLNYLYTYASNTNKEEFDLFRSQIQMSKYPLVYKMKLLNLINSMQKEKEGAIAIDKFWLNEASKYNIIYKSYRDQ